MKQILLLSILLSSNLFSQSKEITEAIYYYSKKHNLDYKLMDSLVFKESTYRTKVKSNCNAIGLMQVRFKFWQKLCKLKNESELLDADKNLDCGMKVFKYKLKKKNGNLFEALTSYNIGLYEKRQNKINQGNRYAKEILELAKNK